MKPSAQQAPDPGTPDPPTASREARRQSRHGALSAADARFAAQRLAFGPLAFHATLALRDLGVLSALMQSGERGASAAQLSEKLDLSRYALTVLLEAGMGAELLTSTEGRYQLSKVGYFVLHDEMTRVNLNFVRDICYQGAQELIPSLREGRPAGLKYLGDWCTIYEGIASLQEPGRTSWFEFDHYYSSSAFPDALPLVFRSPVAKLLDVGGNTGKWAVLCAKRQPSIQVTIVDDAPQIRQALLRAQQAGVSDRVCGTVCDLLDHARDFPPNQDVVWMSQLLSCFAESDIVQLLRRAARALKRGGRLLILETFWDRQKHEGATYNLQQLSLYFTSIANGVSRIYDFSTIRDCVSAAGLSIEGVTDGLGLSHTLLACRVARQ